MILAVPMLMFIFKRQKLNREAALLIPYLIIQIVIDCLNGFHLQAIFSQILFVFNAVCAFSYFASMEKKESLEKTFDAIIDFGILYGSISFVAIIIYCLGLNVPGIIANQRSDPGFFVKLMTTDAATSMLNIVYRFRGFTSDPNLILLSFVLPWTLSRYLCINRKSKYDRYKYFLLVVLIATIVIASNSRTGLLVFLAILIFNFTFIGKNIPVKIVTISIILVITCILFTELTVDFGSLFKNRASLTSSNGRLTIWENAINYLWNTSPWVGLGSGQISSPEHLGIQCHNTWVEWICGNGVIFGTMINIFFFSYGIRIKKYIDERNLRNALLICYYMTILLLFTVDDIADTSLLFNIALFSYISNRKKELRL
jgi:O-antigen ligase